MKTKKTLPKDSDLVGVDKALKRAARKAKELAIKTHQEPGCSALIYPVARAAAMPREVITAAAWPACRTNFLGTRSATIPPKTDTTMLGKALTREMMPRITAEPVKR